MIKKSLLKSANETAMLAAAFAPLLSAGNTILLSGTVGAGKTHFARELISTCLKNIDALEDIPSPTFTLVQTYELNDVDIWHADLYRLSNLSEIYELGLDTAFDTAICLLEWPERLGELLPKNALSLNFNITEEDYREITLSWDDAMWDPVITAALEVFNNGKP